MKIFLDSDASSVRDIVSNICKEKNIEIILVKNYSQDFNIDYGTVITVDISPDAADYYIVNNLEVGDIVLTNDKGLSSMVLARGGIVMDFFGNIVDDKNISFSLENRHISKNLRKKGVYTKFKKRTKKDDEHFKFKFNKFLEDRDA